MTTVFVSTLWMSGLSGSYFFPEVLLFLAYIFQDHKLVVFQECIYIPISPPLVQREYNIIL